MKTTSNRYKEVEEPKEPGKFTVLALVISIIVSPLGLYLYFVARQKEGSSQMLKLALIFGVLGTVIWGIAAIYWIWTWSILWMIFH